MRVFLANFSSGLVHVAALALLTWLAPPLRWVEFENAMARGQPVIVQMSFAASAAEPEQPIEVKITPDPVPHEPPPPLEIKPEKPTAHTLPQIDVVPVGKLPPQETPVREPDEIEEVEATAEPSDVELNKPKPKEAKPTQAATKSPTPPRKVQPTAVVAQQESIALPFQTATAVGAEVDELPRKLANNPAPIYPAGSLLNGEEGRVMLRVLVRADGGVDVAAVATSSGFASLDEAAIAAVRRWKFSAAKRRGAAVAHEVVVPVRFSIRRS